MHFQYNSNFLQECRGKIYSDFQTQLCVWTLYYELIIKIIIFYPVGLFSTSTVTYNNYFYYSTYLLEVDTMTLAET